MISESSTIIPTCQFPDETSVKFLIGVSSLDLVIIVLSLPSLRPSLHCLQARPVRQGGWLRVGRQGAGVLPEEDKGQEGQIDPLFHTTTSIKTQIPHRCQLVFFLFIFFVFSFMIFLGG